jgi:4-hydroxy-2-oxoheptanedioate aldolase
MVRVIMRKNAAKQKLLTGRPILAVMDALHNPSLIEMLSFLDPDAVIVDCEHSPLNPETEVELYRAADLRGISTITRVLEISPALIQKSLDFGSSGVMVPLVRTLDDVQATVLATKYPPLGNRGLGPVRALDYGLSLPLSEYTEFANNETLVAIQIETNEAIKIFDQIINLESVDVIVFGPADISCAIGHPGQPQHPDVISLIERLGKKAIQAGKIAGTLSNNFAEYQYWREKGFLFLIVNLSKLVIECYRDLHDRIHNYENQFSST